MKLKALVLALFVAGLGASFALAEDGGSGSTTSTSTTTTGTTTKKEEHGKDCRKLELKGTLASASGTSFVMNVVKANKAGDALEGKPATIAVDAKTRVRWEGVGTFAGPNTGDRLNVLAVQCTATGDALVARKVDARPPKAEKAVEASTGEKKHDGDEKKPEEKHK
jgi:hypothetical protein